MNLEFKLYRLKKGCRMYNEIKENNLPNEFIIVGEEKIGELDCYKAQQIFKDGIRLINGAKINEMVCLFKKEDMELACDDDFGCDVVEFDIDIEQLTLQIVDDIQRLNSFH